ncbi:MAG TPA: hypothetical protein VK453_23565 [Micromonosporaceae bacterium]|nr:hypothetical protein [Micromonosporaceae bacterium]
MRPRIKRPLRLAAQALVMLVAASASALAVSTPAQAATTFFAGHTSYWRYQSTQQLVFGIGTNEVEMEGWGTDINGTRTLFGTITVAEGVCAAVVTPTGSMGGGSVTIGSACSGTSRTFAFPVSAGQMNIGIQAAPIRGGWFDRNAVVLPVSTPNLRRAGVSVDQSETASEKTFNISMRGMSLRGEISSGAIAIWVYHNAPTGCARGDITNVFKELQARAEVCDGRVTSSIVRDNLSGIVVYASYIPAVLPATTVMLQV